MNEKTKLNLGCGRQVIPEFINVDKENLPGVDVVCDLSKSPWPFNDNQFDFILVSHLLEHMPETVPTMKELWRISKPSGRTVIRVPFWNSFHSFRDPTHFRGFHGQSFEFYDPAYPLWNQCNYYTHSTFEIVRKEYSISLMGGVDEKGWYQIKSPFLMRVLDMLARHICGVIYFVEVELRAIK